MSYEGFSFAYIEQGYRKFASFLIEEIGKGNFDPMMRIMNGDDFFGKFLLKVMSNSKLERLCEAAKGRFALSYDGQIYPCSPAIYHPELALSSEEIEKGED